jgi:uncharacterized protein (AIM24 family)
MFGGEGFVMQKISGSGYVFLERLNPQEWRRFRPPVRPSPIDAIVA